MTWVVKECCRRKNEFFFQVQEWQRSMKTEIKLRVHQLNLDVEDSEGKQWELPDHCTRFRQREAILCAIGSEKQEFP